MTQIIRRYEAGWDQFGHHWEKAGQVLPIPDDQASQLLGETGQTLYAMIEHGATIEAGEHPDAVGTGDPAVLDEDAEDDAVEDDAAEDDAAEDDAAEDDAAEKSALSDHNAAGRHEATAEEAKPRRTVVARSRTAE